MGGGLGKAQTTEEESHECEKMSAKCKLIQYNYLLQYKTCLECLKAKPVWIVHFGLIGTQNMFSLL